MNKIVGSVWSGIFKKLKRAKKKKKKKKRKRSVIAPPTKDEDPRSRMVRVLSSALDSATRRLKQNRENTEKLASLIEAKLWTKFGAINPSYQSQMRSICLNLNDPKNNDFARRVFQGTIPLERLAEMHPSEFASERALKIRKSVLKRHSDMYKNAAKSHMAESNAYKCPECGKSKTIVSSPYRSGAGRESVKSETWGRKDEPGTPITIQCCACDHTWTKVVHA